MKTRILNGLVTLTAITGSQLVIQSKLVNQMQKILMLHIR